MLRRFASFAASAALLFAASPALAVVTEPNGLIVPLDSQNGEVQLYQLFTQLGEPIDWQADAASAPNAFSPLCSFSAKFILHQAGFNLGLSWYNETGAPPQAQDLHLIVPAGSPVGTTITSTDIQNDPAYLGGLVGFALVGQQTHYTNPAYNPVCSGCNPPGPWIAAVIYASKNTPNAFYIAFEDGNLTSASFNNDGDFNDDVYFLTGITCQGGGEPCDTGLPGICGQGLTECTPNGVICKGLNMAAPAETCNGLDDDCNGSTDEGDICPSGFVCDKGTCVESCTGGEFTCPPNKVCDSNGYCVDPLCQNVLCPSGTVCVGGICKGPCDDVACPYPYVCRVGACVDPCAGVACEMGKVCEGGVCITDCSCAPCGGGLACDTVSGHCIDPMCIGVPACASGTHCVGGVCIDNCQGAMCPAGQSCMMGQCIENPGTGGAGSTGAFMVGGGGPGGSTGASMSTGTGGQGGQGGAAGGAGGGGVNESKGGCGCRTAEGEAEASFALFGLALAAAHVRGRRRRARGAQR